jgi:hypothetical protein
MVNKKKKMPVQKRNLEACQDVYEQAMLEVEADRPEGFKRHMGKAIVDAEALLAETKGGHPGEETEEELAEFVAQCCFELGTYVLEDDHDDADGTKCAKRAKPYLERSVDLYRGQADSSKSFCRPAVIALSTAYAMMHEHDEDIKLCEEFVSRLTKQYNQWTPMQNDVLMALAGAFNNVGRMEDAERIYREIVSICKTNYGEENERTVEAQAELDEFLQEKDFGVCECKLTKGQIAALNARMLNDKELQESDQK